MASRTLAHYVTVADEKGEQHTFGPDSDVPAWASKAITNPAAWADGDVDQVDGSEDGGEGDGPKPYSKWLKADLEAEVDRRNEGREDDDLIEVDEPGNKPELVAALEADDAAQA
ncbi:MAG: hypothetical protein HOV78_11675 [Hamadaea sp.]|nr:hypothetical protein [Hamadaea sp.]